MERTITVDGVGRLFRTSGLTPRIYRGITGRDVFKDIAQLEVGIAQQEITPELLMVFEDLSYTLLKQGNDFLPDEDERKIKPFPETPDAWLDTVEIWDIWDVFPSVAMLWREGNLTLVESKKKTPGEVIGS